MKNLEVQILTITGETDNDISLLCQIGSDIKILQIPLPGAKRAGERTVLHFWGTGRHHRACH